MISNLLFSSLRVLLAVLFVFVRFWGSIVGWLIVVCLLGLVFVKTYYPWEQIALLNNPRWVIEFAKVIPFYVESSTAASPVIILGSSLIQVVEREHSIEVFKEPGGNTGFLSPYSFGLSRKLGHSISITSLAVPGAMISDDFVIVKELLNSNKKPRIVFLTCAPRDFMCNDVGTRLTSTPTSITIAAFRRLRRIFPARLTVASIYDFCGENLRFFDSIRTIARRSLVESFCSFTGHPKSLWEAQHGLENRNLRSVNQSNSKQESSNASSKSLTRDKLEEDIERYRLRYNPPAWAGYQIQIEKFVSLIQLCRENNICLVVVNMPLTDLNLSLLPRNARNRIFREVPEICRRCQVPFVDLNNSAHLNLGLNDFDDTCHLNKNGAQKFNPVFENILFNSIERNLKSKF